MKPISIFRHVNSEGPGYFGDFLNRHQIPFQVVKLDQGQAVPTSLEDTSALVFMGGPMSVNDDLAWIEPELTLIRQAIEKNMPVLGHCLGGQLISKALGGTVTSNPLKEYGWLPVQHQANHAAIDWLAGLPDSFDAFHWHSETFSIPRGAINILASEFCPHQAFVIGNTLALQCHVEMTREMVVDWTTRHAEEIANATPSIQTRAQQLDALDKKIALLQFHADLLYTRWMQPLLHL